MERKREETLHNKLPVPFLYVFLVPYSIKSDKKTRNMEIVVKLEP